MRASRVRCFLLSEGLNHYVAQVRSSADGTKITNTGTTSDGDPVVISARPPRPSGHFRRPRRLPRAQVQSASGADITVSDGGKAEIYVRDPRLLLRPHENEGTRTQALGGFPVTFDCYGADVTATPAVPSTPAVCDGP